MSSDIKIKVQSFGRFLSNMVMPNIGAFIAWGIITALFIPTGWLPNETLAKLVGPMITYLLPLLIGYTGGKLVGGGTWRRSRCHHYHGRYRRRRHADVPRFYDCRSAGRLVH